MRRLPPERLTARHLNPDFVPRARYDQLVAENQQQAETVRALADELAGWQLRYGDPPLEGVESLPVPRDALVAANQQLRDALERIEALLGNVKLDELPTEWATRVERAWIESRHDWPADDPLRLAMLAEIEKHGALAGTPSEEGTAANAGPLHVRSRIVRQVVAGTPSEDTEGEEMSKVTTEEGRAGS